MSEKNRDPYWEALNRGFEDAAARLDVQLDIRAPMGEDGAEQRQQLEAMLADGVDALAVVASDAALLSPVIERAITAGIPVVCFDLDAPDSMRIAHVGTRDYPALGRMAANALAAILPPASDVLVQVGSRHAPGALGKAKGFTHEMGLLGHHVVAVTYDAHDGDEAEAQAVRVLAQNPRVRGIFGVYGYHPGAQARAVQQANPAERPAIVGFDLLPDTLSGLRDGTIHASIWLQEFYFGYLSTTLLHNMVKVGVLETATMCGFDPSATKGNRLIIEPILVNSATLGELAPKLNRMGLIG